MEIVNETAVVSTETTNAKTHGRAQEEGQETRRSSTRTTTSNRRTQGTRRQNSNKEEGQEATSTRTRRTRTTTSKDGDAKPTTRRTTSRRTTLKEGDKVETTSTRTRRTRTTTPKDGDVKTSTRRTTTRRTTNKTTEKAEATTNRTTRTRTSRTYGEGRMSRAGSEGNNRRTNNRPRTQIKDVTNSNSPLPTTVAPETKGRLLIMPLGGLGEIGKNMTIFQYEDDIVVLDAGLAFPTEDMPGVDIVIPDMSYLIANRDKVRAVVITHGHEDHIGSLSYFVKQVGTHIPIYAANLVAGLIDGKFKESRLSTKNVNIIAAGDEIQAGVMKVGFIQTNHSIPDSLAVYFETPVGTIVHTGDFKIDQTPVDGRLMDVHKFAELGNKGVLALMADSTNVERPGYTGSESTVGPALMRAVGEAKGRIVLATFASNVSRIQQAIDAAVAYKRKVVVLGRSMVNVTEIAQERGYLNVPEGTIIGDDEMNRYRPDEIMVLTTGSQGEPMAGLSRMATANHRSVEIVPNDTIIISATPIPGNEGAVGRTIDNLLRLGANVIYGKDRGIHVSGHASQEELKIMQNLVRPKYFIPVHGEYRMLRKHGELAVSMGVDPKNVLVGDNGQIFEFTKEGGRLAGHIPSGNVFVDGLGVGDVGNIVIRDRQQLAAEGMVIVVMAMDKLSGAIVSGPDIVSRGFVYMRDAEDLISEAQERVETAVDRCQAERIKDWTTIKNNVRDALGKFLYEKTRRRPMILTIIQDV